MAMDVVLTGANLDGAGNVKVALSNTPAYIGGARFFTENDPGNLVGDPYLKSPETSPDFRLRTGMDTVLFTDTFNATTQNTNIWAYTFATMTASQPGAGTVNFGTVQGTTSAHGAFMRTWQYFTLVNTAAVAAEFIAGKMTADLVAGEVWLMGLGLPSAAITRPTDGVWFKLTSAGLIGVLAYNNTEVESGVFPGVAPAVGDLDKYTIVVGEREIEFWFNDQFCGELAIPDANGIPWMSASAPVFMQKYNTGAVSNTNTMRVARVGVTQLDIATSRAWAVSNAVAGLGAYMGQNGQTMGTSQFTGTITSGSSPNLPTAAAGSNTAANVTGLGGWGAINAAAGAATDFIGTSYQNPAGTINITGRNLLIRGVKITAINTGAAVATTPTTLLWTLAFGHTAVSLATTETASFATATTHAPRRVQLGFMSAEVATPIGGLYSGDVSFNFDSPIVVRPGEFLATMMKIVVGTATASQTITYNVVFDGSFE
jgi:hypothetical protein